MCMYVGTYVHTVVCTYICNSVAVLMICACDIGHSLCEVLTVCYAFLCRVFRKVAYTRNETFNKSPTRRCVCRIVQRSFMFTCCETV